MPVPDLPLELHREIILQSALPSIDPLEQERGPAYTSTAPDRRVVSHVAISKQLALVSKDWNVSLVSAGAFQG